MLLLRNDKWIFFFFLLPANLPNHFKGIFTISFAQDGVLLVSLVFAAFVGYSEFHIVDSTELSALDYKISRLKYTVREGKVFDPLLIL